MDLLLIKLERVDNDFYERLIKFISDHGYKPKVIVYNTDSLSINGLEIISSKRQLFRRKEEISMTNKEKVERRRISVEEQEIFLDYLLRTKNWYEEIYQFMLLTGMRIGEIGGLQWEDIDFANKFIYVKKTLSYQYENGKKTMKLTSPKTENSVRKIPFFGETREILERQFEKVKRKRVDLGERWRQPEELGNLVFLTSMGSPIGRYSVESDMRYVTKQINDMFRTEALYTGGIPKKFERVHPHALRHTFATRCFEKGMTPRTVQEIMGHANYNTTVSYTPVLDDIKLKEAERLGDFLQNKNNDETVECIGLLGIM